MSKVHWLLFLVCVVTFTDSQPASAQTSTGDYCIEILRQGVYDFYSERRANSSFSDVRAALMDQMCSSRNAAAGGGVSVGYGPLSVGGNYSKEEAESTCKLLGKSNSELIDQRSQLMSNITKINPAALNAFNQCMALGGRGLEAAHTAVSNDVFSLSLRCTTPGCSVDLQRLGMSQPGAFECRGSLAAMAVSGGAIGNSAVNMVCVRQVQRNSYGDLTASAPPVTLTVESGQGLFRYDFPRLTLPVQRIAAGVPIGTILPFAGNKVPDGWLFCDGTSYPAADYKELADVLGVTGATSKFTVPDLRGRFLRGLNDDAAAGSGRDSEKRQVGSFQDWATARPRAGFRTDETGNHNHGNLISVQVSGCDTVHERTDCSPSEINIRHPGARIGNDGSHRHSVSEGGDAETRPANVAARFVIHAGVKGP